MIYYNTTDHTTNENQTHFTATAAKRWMKERIKLGHEVTGSKTKVYANGDWEPCGPIVLKGSNAVQMSNQTTATYK